MSFQYDQYLAQHRSNVKRGYEWLCENLPDVIKDAVNAGFAHDQSKDEPDEYNAYDAYFYGNNRSFKVVQDYQRAWLLHIHRNPHHWQHWVLINDDPKEGEIVLEMPYDYIIEMICDWWAFSWAQENLDEIFNWYEEHSKYMKLAPDTRKTVEDILSKIKAKLDEDSNAEIQHSGVKGMKWGVRNGPPYPIEENKKVAKVRRHDNLVEEAIHSGEVSKTVNKDKQKRHTKSDHLPGRSYLDGDVEYAQKLVDKYGGKGESRLDRNGHWNHRERITADHDIGTYVDESGNEVVSNTAMIVYSKTGTHVYPARRKEKNNA
ncbi:DUF5662 family protein [Ruminococcus sp. 1001275B_160808_F8]|uniref:DUF5662 family protein n=1 Tax=Ruminococcus sp. 1001275B_160808_F8 TaxID=2787131 RepID=UPI0018A8F78B|nr:DUF5662 family protein [Ruminococcus sp. 1001275B_160808_F8]